MSAEEFKQTAESLHGKNPTTSQSTIAQENWTMKVGTWDEDVDVTLVNSGGQFSLEVKGEKIEIKSQSLSGFEDALNKASDIFFEGPEEKPEISWTEEKQGSWTEIEQKKSKLKPTAKLPPTPKLK